MKTKTAIWLSIGIVVAAGVAIYVVKENRKKEQEIKDLEKKNEQIKSQNGMLESLLSNISA